MALPSYKEIIELIKKGSTLEAQEQIIALREAALGLQEENIILKERLKELEEANRKKGITIFEDGVYWTIENKKKRWPFLSTMF